MVLYDFLKNKLTYLAIGSSIIFLANCSLEFNEDIEIKYNKENKIVEKTIKKYDGKINNKIIEKYNYGEDGELESIISEIDEGDDGKIDLKIKDYNFEYDDEGNIIQFNRGIDKNLDGKYEEIEIHKPNSIQEYLI
ncbi:MAG: hypothetical protein AB7V77_04280 [Candidatus Woesearchaeota archaeon]